MKTKEIIINDIESLINLEYSNYTIGLMEFITINALALANNFDLVYSFNCNRDIEAYEIYIYFRNKKVERNNLTKNNAKGIYLIRK
jgi:hypothetical protein